MTEPANALADSEAIIARLGAHGDGISDTAQGALFVPYTVPGDHVRIARDGGRVRLVEVIAAGADRVAPLCRHFTHCGGCATQQLAPTAQARWKAGIVTTAFHQQGIEPPLKPIIQAGPHSRRRAVFAARRTGSGVVLGFHEPHGHAIVDLAMCPILAPAIEARMPALRALAGALLSRAGEARFTVVAADNGVDVSVEDAKPELGADERLRIAELARSAHVIRLSIGSVPVFETAAPVLRFGPALAELPPGVFLQAVAAAEAEMTALILDAVGKAKRVADLYSGLGTFTFPLAARAEVSAFDSDKEAIGALVAAARRTQGIKPVTAGRRDLHIDPLSARELNGFDAVVFDPPRSGALAQAERLARSEVPVVAAVSCAPGTLARDVKALIEGGYALQSVTPIDQFLFAPHVEAIAVLKRPRKRR